MGNSRGHVGAIQLVWVEYDTQCSSYIEALLQSGTSSKIKTHSLHHLQVNCTRRVVSHHSLVRTLIFFIGIVL